MIDLLAPQIPQEWMTLGKKLVKDYEAGTITEKEFDRECSYLAYNCGFNELKLKMYPVKPYKLTEYERMTDSEQHKIGETFWKRKDIASYLKEYNSVRNHNVTTRHWLKLLEIRFQQYGDYKRSEECKARLT